MFIKLVRDSEIVYLDLEDHLQEKSDLGSLGFGLFLFGLPLHFFL